MLTFGIQEPQNDTHITMYNDRYGVIMADDKAMTMWIRHQNQPKPLVCWFKYSSSGLVETTEIILNWHNNSKVDHFGHYKMCLVYIALSSTIRTLYLSLCMVMGVSFWGLFIASGPGDLAILLSNSIEEWPAMNPWPEAMTKESCSKMNILNIQVDIHNSG